MKTAVKYTWKLKGEVNEEVLFLKTIEQIEFFDFVIKLKLDNTSTIGILCDKREFNMLKYLYSEAYSCWVEDECPTDGDYVNAISKLLRYWGYIQCDNKGDILDIEYINREYIDTKHMTISELESILGYAIEIISEEQNMSEIYDESDYVDEE